jgi:molybdenum cofactor guanylyltransferase
MKKPSANDVAPQTGSAGLAAAITAGGQSRRFGQDKALYKVGGQTLLRRVAASLNDCSPRLLIAPLGRYELPGWQTAPDLRPGQGPLVGLETALSVLLTLRPGGGWLAFSAVDLPHLTPAYWALLATRCGSGLEAVLGSDESGRSQPLAACYHTSALPAVSTLLEGEERRMSALTEAVRAQHVAWSEIEPVSPLVYVNLNTRPI